jgi:hypothetical protein
MEMMIFVWLFACVLVGVIASGRRNRSGIAWFLLAFLFSPILMGILVLAMSTLEKGGGRIILEGENNPSPNSWLLGRSDRRPWGATNNWGRRRGPSHWDKLAAKTDW